MSSAEFAEWQSFQLLEGPLGEQREDWRAGMVASVIANANRDPKKSRRAYEPRDFIPDWGERVRRRPDPLEVADKVKGYFQRLAAKGAGRR